MRYSKALKTIRQYGFIAEPFMKMTESEAAQRNKAEGVPSFERIIAGAVRKGVLSPEAFAPAKKAAERREGRGRRRLIRGISFAAAALVLIVLFAVTPAGSTAARSVWRGVKQLASSISFGVPTAEPTLLPETDLPTEAATEAPTETPAETPAELTALPTKEAALPAITAGPTGFDAETPAPTAEPTHTPAPTPHETAHCCGEPGCAEGTFMGLPACTKDGKLHICSANFPDELFAAYLRSELGSAAVSEAGAKAVKKLTVPEGNVKSIEGTGYFSELTWLIFDGTRVKTADLSKNAKLTVLECSSCPLEELNVTGCKKLETLYCRGCELTELDISSCGALVWLECSGCRIKALDASACRKLELLRCENNGLESLKLPKNGAFEQLDCSGNSLKKLDLSGQPRLKFVWASSNKLTSLDASGAPELIDLDCGSNRLTEVDLTGCVKLDVLRLGRNRLERIDPSVLGVPVVLDLSENRLAALDLPEWHEYEELILSPQSAAAVTCAEQDGSFLLDMSQAEGVDTDRIASVCGFTADGERIEAAYHPRKGIAKFGFLPVRIEYEYETGAGIMTVTAEVSAS